MLFNQLVCSDVDNDSEMSLDEQTACFSAVCRSITVQKRSLLRVAVGQDGRLGDIKVKSSILLQDVLQVSQNRCWSNGPFI